MEEQNKTFKKIKFRRKFRSFNFNSKKIYKAYFKTSKHSIIEITNLNVAKSKAYFTKTNTIEIIEILNVMLETEANGLCASSTVLILKNGTLIHFNTISNQIDIYHNPKENKANLRLADEFLTFKIPDGYDSKKLSLLTHSSNSFGTNSFELQTFNPQIKHFYNEDFIEIDKAIQEKLSKNESKGLVLLHGDPGTGKTSYIRHLVSKINKEIIFIPTNIANSLTDPSFMEWLLQHRNAILIIEDAEKIITTRANNQNSMISALLNLTDGLLSDILNIQFICTFNTALSNLDEALLRKGRLLAKYEFKALTPKKATALSKHLKHSVNYDRPTKLVDVIYSHDNNFNKTQIKEKLGFN